jgi:lysine-N-methylase
MPFALRYMSEFACLGGDCEDSCCGHWRIDIDEAHYRKLERALTAPEDAARFARAFQVDRSRGHFAVLHPREDGACHFLDGTRLCELHARLGPALLPDVCAHYPRTVAKLGDTLELSGSLGCPEVVRRALTVEGAIERVEVADEKLGRGILTQTAQSGPDWWRPLDRVRWALHARLRAEGPLALKLWRLLGLATRLAEVLHPRARLVDERRLAAELERTPDEELPTEVEDLTESHALVLGKLFTLGRARDCPPALARLIASVLEGYAAGPEPPLTLDGDDLQADLAALAAAHAQRRSGLADGELDGYFQRYGQNYVLREWYAYAPSLSTNLLQLALRVAMLRFLVIGHPGLEAALAASDRHQRVSALVVEVVYAFSRAVEHSQKLVADYSATVEAELDTPEKARRLLLL